jgi:hypothetical protein
MNFDPIRYIKAAPGVADRLADRQNRTAILKTWLARQDPTIRPYAGRLCLEKIVRPSHRCNSSQCYGNGRNPRNFDGDPLDHFEGWRTATRFILTGHPYDLRIESLSRWCRAHDLKLETRPTAESWYYPGATHLVVLYGNEGTPASWPRQCPWRVLGRHLNVISRHVREDRARLALEAARRFDPWATLDKEGGLK